MIKKSPIAGHKSRNHRESILRHSWTKRSLSIPKPPLKVLSPKRSSCESGGRLRDYAPRTTVRLQNQPIREATVDVTDGSFQLNGATFTNETSASIIYSRENPGVHYSATKSDFTRMEMGGISWSVTNGRISERMFRPRQSCMLKICPKKPRKEARTSAIPMT